MRNESTKHLSTMRRSKRLRRQDARLNVNGSGSSILRRKTYFDNLPEEALINIVHFISERPRHPSWQCHLLPQNALQLYRPNSPLYSAAHLVMQNLVLAPRAPSSTSTEEHGITVRSTSDDDSPLLIDILVSGGAAIHEFNIFYAIHPTRWTISAMEYCRNLKKLAIHVDKPLPIESMLATWGGKLQSLILNRSFMRKTEIDAMAKHCTGLKRLEFGIHRETKGDLEKLWKKIGPTLKHLSITVSTCMLSTRRRCLSDIAKYCKSITSLSLRSWSEVDARSVTNLCKNYGSQLRHLKLFLTSREHDITFFKSVRTNCPNVLVDIDGCTSQPLSMFEIFGSRLANLTITIPPDHFSIPADPCYNLASIRIPAVRTVLEALFAKPKPLMRKLHLMDYSQHGNMRSGMQESMDFLAENVTTIQILALDGVVPSGSSLNLFALANPELHTVDISTGFGNTARCASTASATPIAPGRHENWVSVIRSIAVSSKLKEVKLTCREWSYWHSHATKVADACQQLRFREVSVNVCGLQFL